MHWVSKCPRKSAKRLQSANVTEENDGVLNESDKERVEDAKLVLLTDDAMDCAIFVAETEKSAVVDTACPKTVAGEQWLNNYMTILSDTPLNEVEIFDSHTPFKFGDGRKVYAEGRARIPAQIGNKQCMIDVEIVKENIPLLLSKSSLKKAGTIFNLQLDKAVLFDQDIQLHQWPLCCGDFTKKRDEFKRV